MERKRTNMFVALLLLSPLTLALPMVTTLSSAATTTYTSSAVQTLTYTSAVAQTFYGSTIGNALVQVPIDLTPKIIGFMAPAGKCSQYTYPVSVAAGSILNVGLTSTNPANVYLLPTYTYETSSDGCQVTAPALLFDANFTTYTLHWAAPESGVFYIILTGPTTIIQLRNDGSSQPVEELENVTYASSTSTSLDDYFLTNTVTYTNTLTHPLYFQPQTLPGLWVLAFLLIAGSSGFAGLLIVRGRRP